MDGAIGYLELFVLAVAVYPLWVAGEWALQKAKEMGNA